MTRRQLSSLTLLGLMWTACTTRATEPDVGPLLDTARGTYTPPPTPMPTGRIELRLAHLAPGAPNLTVCLSTIGGTGAPPTEGRILGQPNEAAGLDGTLPFPGISPYVPLPGYDTPGFGYRVRLFRREDLPFVLGGTCPAEDDALAPLFSATVETGPLLSMGTRRATVAAIGLLPGVPAVCAGGCPPPSVLVIPDDPTASATNARIRLVHAIPNVPVPIEVCIDPDQDLLGAMNGPMPAMRALPEASDTDGIRFGEVTAFVELPPLTMRGAITVHAVMGGVPSCVPPTLLLGPFPIPLPVSAERPADIARVFEAGDVISTFALGRATNPCMDDTECFAALGGRCSPTRRICEDPLSPFVLPWQDVMGPSM